MSRGAIGLIAAVVLAFGFALAARPAQAASIRTDMQIYQSGDTVTVTGEGFWPGEPVDFVAWDSLNQLIDMGVATADDLGNVTYQFTLVSSATGLFTEEASGEFSGLYASTQFDPVAGDLYSSSARNVVSHTFRTSTTVFAQYTGLAASTQYQRSVYTSAGVPVTGLSQCATTGASTSLNDQFPAPATLSSNNTPYELRLYGPIVGTCPLGAPGSPILTKSFNSVDLAFFDDAARTHAATSFEPGQTVYVRGDGFVPSSSITSMVAELVPGDVDSCTATTPCAVDATGAFTGSIGIPANAALATRNIAATTSTGDTVRKTITIAGGPPACPNASVSTAESTSKSITLVCTDTDPGDSVASYAVVTGPTHGALSGAPPNLTYTPTTGYNGPDSFTFKATDTHGIGSTTATESITVTPVNTVPTANDGAWTGAENGTITLDMTVLAHDTETAAANLVWNLPTTTPHGSLAPTASPGVYTFTPALNFNGTDSFTYSVTDRGDPDNCGTPSPTCAAAASSATKTVTLNITPVNSPPTVQSPTLNTVEDSTTGVSFNLNTFTSDVETANANLTYAISGAAHGTVTPGGTPGSYTYVPAANWNGTDTITYTALDRGDPDNCGAPTITCAAPKTSATATISIVVAPVNDPPTASGASLTLNASSTLSVDLRQYATDLETAAGNLIYNITGAPAHGSFDPAGPNGVYTYTPIQGYNGTDRITYSVTDRGDPDNCGAPSPTCDAAKTSATATVDFTIRHVNTAPVFGPIPTDVITEGGSDTINLESFYLDDSTPASAASYSVVSAPAGLTATIGANHVLTISAPDNLTGDVTVRATDTGDANSGPLSTDTTFHVIVENVAPTATPQPPSTITEDNTPRFRGVIATAEVLTDHAAFDVTLPTAVPAGSTLVVSMGTAAARDDQVISGSVGDSAGNSYPVVGTFAPGDGNHGFTESVAAGDVTHAIPAGSTLTINVGPAYFAYHTVQVWLLTGIKPGGLDKSWFGFGFFTDPIFTGTTAATTQPVELVAAGVIMQHLATLAPGTGYTAPTGAQTNFANANKTMFTEYKVVTEAGTQSATFLPTLKDTNENFVVAFKANVATFTLQAPADASPIDALSLHYAFSCDGSPLDGAVYSLSGTSPSMTCNFNDGPSTHTVRARIMDKDGGFNDYVMTLSITNVPPTATFNAPTTPVDEGSPIPVSLTNADDVSPADIAAGFTYAFDCGNGLGYSAFSSTSTASCPTPDNGTQTVKGEIRDKDGGITEYTQAVTVRNVAPTATFNAPTTAALGDSASVSLSAPFDPSTADTTAGFTYAFDCGSGSGYGALGTSSSATCTFGTAGDVTVKGKIQDKDGGFTEYTQVVHVGSAAPTATFVAPDRVNEGSPIALALTNPDSASAAARAAGFTYAFDCGAGSGYGAFSSTATASCPTSDNGSVTVKGKIRDTFGAVTEYTKPVQIDNVAPTAALGNNGPVDEASPATISFTGQFDPSTIDTSAGFTYRYACNGTVAGLGSVTASASATCTFPDNGSYTVLARILDKDGGFTDYTTPVTVRNVAPTATLSNNGPINEGGSATITFANQLDPSPVDTAAGFQYAYACDGVNFGAPAGNPSATCLFADNGTFTVKARILDKDGGFTDYTTPVTVRNVAPALSAAANQSANEGSSSTFALGSFTDPGVNDAPWGVSVAWGDGTSSSFSVAAPGALSAGHTYADNGNYTATVVVTDKDLGSDTKSFGVAVANVAPTASLSNNGPVNEGSPVTVSFTAQFDPSPVDTAAGFTYRYSCDGTVAGLGSVTSSASSTCTYPDNGPQTVRARILDKDGGFTDYTTPVTVLNVAPTATLSNNGPINEGGAATITVSNQFDPSSTDAAAGFSYRFACDGSTYAPATTIATTTCGFDDGESTHTVRALILDKDGGQSVLATNVVVHNVAPTATLSNNGPVNEGSPATVSFSAQFDPSAADTTAGFSYRYACDGTTAGLSSVTTAASATCTFSQNGTYTVLARIADKDGGSNDYTTSVTVLNVPPTLTAPANQSASEGTGALFQLGSFTDPGTDNPWTIRANWGDGTPDSVLTASAPGTISSTFHNFTASGTYTVTVTVTDKDGGADTKTFTVAVGNVPPTVTAPADQVGSEGTAQTISLGSFSDPGSDSPWAVDVNWGDGTTHTTFNALGTGVLAAQSHTYVDNGNYTVSVKVTDKWGAPSTASFVVRVANVAPTLTAPAGQSANEGTAATFDLGSFGDPGAIDNPWAVDVNWGDSSAHTTFSMATRGALGTRGHTYADNGSYTVTVSVTDKDGGVGTKTFVIAVANLAPTATLTSNSPVNEGSPATISFGSQFDMSPVDTAAGFTYQYACDGINYGASTSSPTAPCTFDDGPSVHTVKARISDKDGGTNEYTTSVTVNNVAPTATLSNNGPVNEGSPATISFSGQFDPSAADTAAGFKYRYACDGLVASLGAVTTATSTTCTWDDGPSSHTVLARITDKDGGSTDRTTTVTVNNVAPTAILAATSPVNEGSASTVSFSGQFDPSTADTTAGFTYSYACDGTTYGTATTSASTSCTMPDNGTKTVRAKILDKDGGATIYSATVSVANVAPTLTQPADQSANEGDNKTYALGTLSDPGVLDSPWTINVTWGDGSGGESFAATSLGAITRAHTYVDNGTYAVTVKATDKDGGVSTLQNFTITVANVAPTPTAPADQTVPEGSAKAFDLGSFADPGSADAPWAVDVNWGDSTAHTTFTTSTRGALGTQNHTYDDNGTYTVTVKVTDKDGGTNSSTFKVVVSNVPPTATLNAPTSVNEGSPITVSLTGPSDPSHADTAAGFTYAFDCGAGSGYGSFSSASTASCPTTDNGTRTIKASIKDKDGGQTEYTQTVTILNVPPTVTAGAAGQTANEGSSTAFNLGSFTDPGADNPWAVDVNWGDGTTHTTFNATTPGSLGTQSHTYADNGNYTVTVIVTDKDGGTDTKTFTIAVANVAPTASLPATASVNEGAPITFTVGPVTDPSPTDTAAGFHYAYDCVGGSLAGAVYATSSAINSVTCVYPNGPATPTMKARVIDKDGGYTEMTVAVTVNNVAPTLTFSTSNPLSVTPGSTQTYAFTATDPGTTDTISIVNTSCGTGGSVVAASLTFSAGSGSFKCAFGSTAGTTTVSAAAKDSDGATGAAANQNVVITAPANPPVVTITTPVTNQSFTHGASNIFMTSSYTTGGGGPYTCTINWGDPGTTPVVTTLTGLTGTSCQATHQYANASATAVTITVTVQDKYGAPGTATRNIWVR